MHIVTLVPGDGIGPEISEAATSVIKAAGVDIQWESFEAGAAAIAQHQDPLPVPLIESIRKHRVALKGPLTTPVGTGFRSVNVALRKEFDLFVNLRPARSVEGVRTHWEGIDLIVFRENTEEFY